VPDRFADTSCFRERDKDKDGKLNFQEYFNGLFDSLRNYDEVHNESDTSETTPAKKIFQELDQDKDGCSFGKLLLDLNTEKYLSRVLIVGKYPFLRFLSSDELKPVIGTLHPSEHYYANSKLIMCYHR